MDIIDDIKYAEAEVDETMAHAYRTVFNDTPEARIVLSDLMKQCCWGMYSSDPESQKVITIAQKPMWKIKAMLNGKATEIKETVTDE